MLNAAERLTAAFYDHGRPAYHARVYGPRVTAHKDEGKSYGLVWKIVGRDTRADGAPVLRVTPFNPGKVYPPAKAGSREAKRRFGQRVARAGLL